MRSSIQLHPRKDFKNTLTCFRVAFASVGFCAFAQKHFDRVAPVRYGAVMIPCIFSLSVMDQFHFIAQSAAYRGNDADFAVRRTLKLALGLFLLPHLHHLNVDAAAGGHSIRYL